MATLGGYGEIAEARRNGAPITKEDLGRVKDNVRSLYDGGTLFFDKEHIRRIGNQLSEAARTGETCWVPVNGLDGVSVEFEVQVGRVSPTIGSVLESVT